jgi:hypothetical protein
MVRMAGQLLIRSQADTLLCRRFGLESAEEMAEWVVDRYGVSSGSDYPTMLDGQSRPAHITKSIPN